jgi:hypothetical protein
MTGMAPKSGPKPAFFLKFTAIFPKTEVPGKPLRITIHKPPPYIRHGDAGCFSFSEKSEDKRIEIQELKKVNHVGPSSL